MIIIDHNHRAYKAKRRKLRGAKYNGAYYYSAEIVKNIIPNVKTDRPWITVNCRGYAANRAIVFVHNNMHPEHYKWLRMYKDIVLVCSQETTVKKMKELGFKDVICLPLSIDVEYVKQFRIPKSERRGCAYVGRPGKREFDGVELPDDITIIEGVSRPEMLKRMAKFETVYAVGRTAIEAKALGLKLKAFDPRFPKVSHWKVLDNKEAAKMLQKMLDEIDGIVRYEKGK